MHSLNLCRVHYCNVTFYATHTRLCIVTITAAHTYTPTHTHTHHCTHTYTHTYLHTHNHTHVLGTVVLFFN